MLRTLATELLVMVSGPLETVRVPELFKPLMVWLAAARPLFSSTVMPEGIHATSVTTGMPPLQFAAVAQVPPVAPIKLLVHAPTVEVIVVTSEAVSLLVLVSLPPETTTVLVTEGGAPVDTLTVRVITGYGRPAPKASERVQVNVPTEQVQPVPDMVVAVRPEGRASVRLTVPIVGPVPLFVTVMEYCAADCPWAKFPPCDFETVRSGTFVLLCGAKTKMARSAVGDPPLQLAQVA